jgi:hypothetical protein
VFYAVRYGKCKREERWKEVKVRKGQRNGRKGARNEHTKIIPVEFEQEFSIDNK